MLPATLPPTNGNSGGSITVVVTVGTGDAAGVTVSIRASLSKRTYMHVQVSQQC